MNLLSVAAGYVMSVILKTTGIAFLFVLFAFILYILCKKFGLTKISNNDAKFIKLFKISGTTIVGLLIGIITGSQIAVTSVSMNVLNDHGPTIINQAMEQAVKPMGFQLGQELDISNVSKIIGEMNDVILVEGSGISAMILNGAFDLVRTPFVSGAERFVSDLAPNDKINPASIVTAIWKEIYSGIELSNQSFIVSTLSTGLFWLLLSFGIALTIIQVLKLLFKIIFKSPKLETVPDVSNGERKTAN